MDQLASGNALICGRYQNADGLTGRLGVGIPPVLDTVSASCSHNFILDRPVLSIILLSIVHDILAEKRPLTNLISAKTRIDYTTFIAHLTRDGSSFLIPADQAECQKRCKHLQKLIRQYEKSAAMLRQEELSQCL